MRDAGIDGEIAISVLAATAPKSRKKPAAAPAAAPMDVDREGRDAPEVIELDSD